MNDSTQSIDSLMAQLYPVARRLAARQLGRRSGTLQATELVGSAYIKLKQSDPNLQLSEAHFMSLLARVLRQLVADHWRLKGRLKRQGQAITATLSELVDDDLSQTALLRLNELLDRLQAHDEAAATVTCLRVFGGLTGAEIAEHMGLGSATVTRKWSMASAWLRAELGA